MAGLALPDLIGRLIDLGMEAARDGRTPGGRIDGEPG
jgi:hypothetical protein